MTKRWQNLTLCKAVTVDEGSFLEQWGQRDKKRYYMDNTQFEKVTLLNKDMTTVITNLRTEAAKSGDTPFLEKRKYLGIYTTKFTFVAKLLAVM